MKSSSAKLAVCLITALCMGLAFAQLAPAQTTPNAYVYVVSNPSTNNFELDGYRADSTGALTPLAGSPFWKTTNPLTALANTSHFLFVSDGTSIYSFTIASTGALKQVSSVNAAEHYGFSGIAGDPLTLDHTGATLYASALDGVGDNQFLIFNKNNTTGALSFSGSTGFDISFGPLAFISNNLFAYGFGCFQDESHAYGFQRSSNGTLTRLNLNVPVPTLANGDYCLNNGTGFPSNNLAVAMYPETTSAPGPPAALAVYTVDGSGNLSTNSTTQNMPTTTAGTLNDLKASPAGNLLAIGGSSGLQIFHLNGTNPITAYTGLLAVHNISQILWDTHDHLYGISASGRLYAFKITATGNKQAAGSPYTTPNPRAIAVVSQ
jgi:hypothetical protein